MWNNYTNALYGERGPKNKLLYVRGGHAHTEHVFFPREIACVVMTHLQIEVGVLFQTPFV
jgi:hypothetical protein